MSKKKLNITNIANELEGASLFFTKPASSQPNEQKIAEKESRSEKASPILESTQVQSSNLEDAKKEIEEKPKKLSNHDAVMPRHHDTMTPRYHDTTQPSINEETVSLVRKAVKEFGKEAATHRFTEAEKKEIADLIYTYKNRGIKTSENEITRISVNFIIEDYKENGENSVLHKILEALND